MNRRAGCQKKSSCLLLVGQRDTAAGRREAPTRRRTNSKSPDLFCSAFGDRENFLCSRHATLIRHRMTAFEQANTPQVRKVPVFHRNCATLDAIAQQFSTAAAISALALPAPTTQIL